MAVYKMRRTRTDDTNSGGWWHTYLTTSGTSDTYEMPIQPVICIGASVTTTSGAGNLQFSIDSEEKLNDGSAVFASWDGVADINTAVTGFRLVATSGLLTAAVAVKTTQAS